MTLRDLKEEERLLIVQAIPYYSFKEKIATTKEYEGRARVEVMDDIVYTEKTRKVV
ncbi:MAG TPA: hypothetical protein VK071_04360 [Tissierellales bacterium]|nr:hypothetical protein [Tissierellales bacterium]